MSLNSLLEQIHTPEVEALKNLLGPITLQWQSAATEEQRLLVESQAIELFQNLISLSIERDMVTAGEHPEVQRFGTNFAFQKYLSNLGLAKTNALSNLYLRYFNNQRVSLMELIGLLRRVKQKSAVLSLWDRERAKYVVAERFLNLDNLSTSFTSLAECDVNTAQGILTLPVKQVTTLSPSNIRIGSGSNGFPGNSDTAITTNNIQPVYMLNGNPDNWFEYERLDSGPLALTLQLELQREEIVNALAIEPVNLSNSLGYRVDDILFTKSGSKSISIKELLGSTVDPEFWTIKSVGNDTFWSISFLPVQCKNISIKLVQDQAYLIQMATKDDREVTRNRYAIGIKNLTLQRKEYSKTGGINSKELVLLGSLYAGLPFGKSIPGMEKLFAASLDVSFDGGESWQENCLDFGVEKSRTLLLNGSESSLIWRLKLDRNDGAFSNITSFLDTEKQFDVQTLLRTTSKLISPAEVALPVKPLNKEVFAIQPKVLRRGDRFKGVLLGEGTGSTIAFPLPIDVLGGDFNTENLRVLVNGRTWTQVYNEDDLASGTWVFSEDYKELIFSSDLPNGARVQAVLDEERMLFEEKSGGFVHRTDFLFDPEKENINISYLARTPLSRSLVLPRGQKTINLGVTNILDTSFRLSSRDGDVYVLTTDKDEITSGASNKYLVDSVNGILYLATAIITDVVKVTFNYHKQVTLDKNAFSIIFDGITPAGIQIHKDAFVANTVTEVMADTTTKVIGIGDGIYTNLSDPFLTDKRVKRLSYDYIIGGSVVVDQTLFGRTTADPPVHEVPYVDGHTEFLGLIQMETERTVATVATADTVTFRLAAGAKVYESFGVSFSDEAIFDPSQIGASALAVDNVGEYFVDYTTGEVTVWIGTGGTLPGGIEINYSYQDPNFDSTNKYSVDYRNGILYAAEDMEDTALIEYKTAIYKMAYDIAKKIDVFSYNAMTNSVSVRTEGLHDINTLVKVIWAKPIADNRFEVLKNYFSPLISTIAFRFN